MILKKNLVVGFMLCIVIFSFVVPFLYGLRDLPDTIAGTGDVVVITQKERSRTLNTTLAEDLLNSQNTTLISPEILFPTIVSGEPILCKGVERRDILEMDSLVLEGDWLGNNTGIIGREAARRLGVTTGDALIVSSPNRPSFAIITIVGIYHSDRPADSFFISTDYARFLLGLGNSTYTMIRLTTDNIAEVYSIVEASGTGIMSVHFPTEPAPDEDYLDTIQPDPGNESADNQSFTPSQPDALFRLGRRYVNFFAVSDSSGGYTSAAIQYGPQTIDIVVAAMLIMTIFLVVVGATVLILRGITEGRQDIGVLVAIGTPRNRMRMFFFKDILFIIAIAAPAGLLIGLSMAYAMAATMPVIAFGHTISPAPMTDILFVLLAGCIAIPLMAWFMGGEAATGEHPKTLFAPLDIEFPSTPLKDVLKEAEN